MRSVKKIPTGKLAAVAKNNTNAKTSAARSRNSSGRSACDGAKSPRNGNGGGGAKGAGTLASNNDARIQQLEKERRKLEKENAERKRKLEKLKEEERATLEAIDHVDKGGMLHATSILKCVGTEQTEWY